MYSMPLSLHHSMHECRLSSSDSWSSPPSSFEPSVCSMPKSMYSGCGSLEDSPRFCKRRRYSMWPKCEGTRSALLPTHINMSKVFSSISETHSWISSNDVDCQEHRYHAKYTILRIHCEDKCYTQHRTLHFCKNRLGIDSICYFIKIPKTPKIDTLICVSRTVSYSHCWDQKPWQEPHSHSPKIATVAHHWALGC